ncbi:MAG TPA: hypothetical protein VMT67_11395 [Terriglobales bacterium]|nr:hypothetical protein [Terriglobales bacterium]
MVAKMPERRAIPDGTRFDRLVVMAQADPIPNPIGGKLYRVKAKCDCGKIIVTLESSLKSGNTKSCGCVRSEKFNIGDVRRTHGKRRTSEYHIWASMVQRCTNPKNSSYHSYGGRGISVCDQWLIFEKFFSDMGERPAGKSIDRIDNNGNYEPGNCRWATDREQHANKRNSKLVTLDGEVITTAEAMRKLGIGKMRALYMMRATGCTRQEAIDYFAAKRKEKGSD